MKSYDHHAVETKWQKVWLKKELGRANDAAKSEKCYILVEFPYPSGDGLHVGHVRSYTALDAVARKSRMQGKNVLFPMGWDAFGLPTENYALKTGIDPRVATKKNVDTFRSQMQRLGISFDWSREVNTTDPTYYRWTQWIFLQLLKHGLAYQATIPISWCPKDKTGLANEEVVGGKCERCGTPVERRLQKQWMLKITAYADRLLKDLDTVNYEERIKTQQVNWIGKSEGAEITFTIGDHDVTVFTTRPDTLFGATYLVLSPEHPLVNEITTPEQKNDVVTYQKKVANKSDLERQSLDKEKTGVFTGAYAVNPVNNENIPVWIADYVLMGYGTGAIMAVPAHDERDYEFAMKFQLPIRQVIRGTDEQKDVAYSGDGIVMNSGSFDGMQSREAKKKIVESLGDTAKLSVNYKLRDWVFSRQHYWGEPIPVVHCEKCGIVPVPEDQLPVELPMVEKYQPSGTGESPLAAIADWVNTVCPTCGNPAKRETDTMPNWAGSSWYFLRYTDPANTKEFASKKKLKHWLPVDLYNGGMEHTTLHLLYSRFWHKFLFDHGFVPTAEPYQRRVSHGIVLAADGRKMSKSFGNVVNPDELVEKFGADSVRLYEMFMGPFADMIPWDPQGIVGMRRFLQRVWNVAERVDAETSIADERAMNRTIMLISKGVDQLGFNVAVSEFMKWSNTWKEGEKVSRKEFEVFLKLLSPFAPHLAEELWSQLGNKTLVSLERWPTYDESLTKAADAKIAVQVNGKLRGTLVLPAGTEQEIVASNAMKLDNVKKFMTGEPRKTIFVKDRLINFVL